MKTKFKTFEGSELEIGDYITITNDKITKIIKELGYDEFTYINKGGFGIVLDVGDDKVVKLTSDEDEAMNSNLLRKYNTKYIVNYYDVREVVEDQCLPLKVFYGEEHLYSVVMDKIEPFDDIEKYIFTAFDNDNIENVEYVD